MTPSADAGQGRTTTALAAPPAVELSIVMPCLNEAETLAICIRKATAFLDAAAIVGEVIVADNGSTDGSIEIARECGARLVPISERGYGAALRGGISASRGRFVIMGDADDSYDFGKIQPLVDRLRDGADLVMGNRFAGGIADGAMPWTHRWIGNPVLSYLGRLFFRTKLRDFHCGIRGFTRAAFDRLDLHTEGMEFASEMVVKAVMLDLRIDEVPFPLAKDGRSRPPHLLTWHDGWRHLRFLMLYSPRWLFLLPGCMLFFAGTAAVAVLLPGPLRVGSITFDIQTMVAASFAALTGFQLVVFAVFAKTFAVREGLHPPASSLDRVYRYVNLELGIMVGTTLTVGGLVCLAVAVHWWKSVGFGALDPEVEMRGLIPGLLFLALGVQTIFASFILSLLGMKARGSTQPFQHVVAGSGTFKHEEIVEAELKS